MFPFEDIELSEIYESKTGASSELGRDIIFDFESRQFLCVDGAMLEHQSTHEKVEQWFELMIKTEPGRFRIYDNDKRFGVNTDELIGYKQLPVGYVFSEIKREIEEASTLNPAVDYLYSFSFKREDNGLKIEFTVHLKNGEEMEVRSIV